MNATVISILRALMTDNVISAFSRDGKRGKRSLNAVPGRIIDIIQGKDRKLDQSDTGFLYRMIVMYRIS